jgi:ATP-dependent phosphofructokinase / diphosphate-dependent phosphofructokinase
MGRYAGWIALHAGIGGGADVILLPEFPYDIEAVAERITARDAWGAHFSIVVVAEGAKPRNGRVSVIEAAGLGKAERLGGAGHLVAAALEQLTGKETRTVVLGHLQRGGSPTSYDRVLATRFGTTAVDVLLSGEHDCMVASRPPDIVTVPLSQIVGRTRTVPVDSDVVRTARAVGIGFGE